MFLFYRLLVSSFVFFAVAVSPLMADGTWEIVHQDNTIFHRDMICLDENQCIVVGAITNAQNNLENTAYIGVSKDGGKTWKQAQYDLPAVAAEIVNVALLSITATDNSNLFAVGARGAIVKSTDGGETWSTTANVKKWVYHYLSFADNMVGLAGSRIGGVVLRTVDGGETWQDISIPSKPLLQQAICIDPNTILALSGDAANSTSKHSFFESDNGGAQWEERELYVSDYGGAPPLAIRLASMVFVNENEGYLAGTH